MMSLHQWHYRRIVDYYGIICLMVYLSFTEDCIFSLASARIPNTNDAPHLKISAGCSIRLVLFTNHYLLGKRQSVIPRVGRRQRRRCFRHHRQLAARQRPPPQRYSSYHVIEIHNRCLSKLLFTASDDLSLSVLEHSKHFD